MGLQKHCKTQRCARAFEIVLVFMNEFEKLKVISQTGQRITSSLELNIVIETLYNDISKLMEASGFVIYLLNKTRNALELKYQSGKQKNVAVAIPMSSEESFCVLAAKTKTHQCVNDVRNEYSKYLNSFYWSEAANEEIIQSFINIPLMIKGEVFGVLSVQSFTKNVYSAADTEVLKSLAAFISIAFNNAEAHRQLMLAKDEMELQKKVIEDKNKDITDSIRYARRIQDALFPPETYIQKTLRRLYKENK